MKFRNFIHGPVTEEREFNGVTYCITGYSRAWRKKMLDEIVGKEKDRIKEASFVEVDEAWEEDTARGNDFEIKFVSRCSGGGEDTAVYKFAETGNRFIKGLSESLMRNISGETEQ